MSMNGVEEIEFKDIKEAREKAHQFLDAHWKFKKNKSKVRSHVYRRLAKEMRIPMREAHIRNFDMEQCREVIRISKRWLDEGS